MTPFIQKVKIDKSKIHIFDGVGVDLKKFKFQIKKKKKIVLFPARVLIEKGIKEFLNSANILSKNYPNWKFHVAGTLNYKKNQKIFINKINKKNIKLNLGLGQFSFLSFCYAPDQDSNLISKINALCLPRNKPMMT